jgi:hypothetical protein
MISFAACIDCPAVLFCQWPGGRFEDPNEAHFMTILLKSQNRGADANSPRKALYSSFSITFQSTDLCQP